MFIFIRSFLKNKWLDKLFVILFCVIGFGISIATDYSNYYIDGSQTLARYKWETIDRFVKEKVAIDLPYDSNIYAPSLLTMIGSAATDETYWSDYLGAKLNKKIVVEKVIDPKNLGDNNYALIYRQKTKDLEQYVIFGKIDRFTKTGSVLIEDPCIYNFSKYDEYSIFGEVDSNKTISIKTEFGDEVKTSNYFIFNININKYVLNNDLKRTCLKGKDFVLDSLVIEDKVNN